MRVKTCAIWVHENLRLKLSAEHRLLAIEEAWGYLGHLINELWCLGEFCGSANIKYKQVKQYNQTQEIDNM